MMKRSGEVANSTMMFSVSPSPIQSCAASPEKFLNGSTAIDGFSGNGGGGFSGMPSSRQIA